MSTVLKEVLSLINTERELSTIDIPVPSLDGKVKVRCAENLDFTRLCELARDHPQEVVFQAAWVVADTCVGVFIDDPDGPVGFHPVAASDPGEWPRMDRDLAKMLPDLPAEPSAVEICISLFGAGYPQGSGRTAMDLLAAQKMIADHNHFDPKALD